MPGILATQTLVNHSGRTGSPGRHSDGLSPPPLAGLSLGRRGKLPVIRVKPQSMIAYILFTLAWAAVAVLVAGACAVASRADAGQQVEPDLGEPPAPQRAVI